MDMAADVAETLDQDDNADAAAQAIRLGYALNNLGVHILAGNPSLAADVAQSCPP